MANPGLSEPKVMEEDARTARRKKAVAGVSKLQSGAFEDSKEQKAPSSVPAWKNIQPPAGN